MASAVLIADPPGTPNGWEDMETIEPGRTIHVMSQVTADKDGHYRTVIQVIGPGTNYNTEFPLDLKAGVPTQGEAWYTTVQGSSLPGEYRIFAKLRQMLPGSGSGRDLVVAQSEDLCWVVE